LFFEVTVTTREDVSKAAGWQGSIDDHLRFMDRIDKTIMALICERVRLVHALGRLSKESAPAADVEKDDDER
jgi:chorismate mutase